MPIIGIVDDREDFRVTLKRRIDLSIKKNDLKWTTIAIYPFPDIRDYISWIKENDISILILDERLQEGNHTAENVNYNGSNLIEFIRDSLQDFPVFAITNYHNDTDLQNRFPLFDEILARDDFFKKADDYTIRFTRAGQRFLDNYNSQLTNLSELSKKAALGTANENDISQLKALQEYLNIPFATLTFTDKEEWLKAYEARLNEVSEISNRIKTFIEANTK